MCSCSYKQAVPACSLYISTQFGLYLHPLVDAPHLNSTWSLLLNEIVSEPPPYLWGLVADYPIFKIFTYLVSEAVRIFQQFTGYVHLIICPCLIYPKISKNNKYLETHILLYGVSTHQHNVRSDKIG